MAVYHRLVERPKAAGARGLAITSIARHFCIRAFAPVSPLPIIDLLAEVDRALAARRLRRVGILGTRVAMQTGFYGAARSTEVIAPAGEALAAVHSAYVTMASSGAVTAEQREVFFSAGRALVQERGVEAVMLGGTDFALAFAGRDPGFPILDCTAVHADAIAEVAHR